MFPFNPQHLQTTLATATSAGESPTGPHHPIMCQGRLRFEEDGTLRCDHVGVPPDDPRTVQVLNHTIAILLIELAQDF